jgi:hypothetical protein
MKSVLICGIIIIIISIFSCNHSTNNEQLLQKHVDSLENQIAGSYKPGFGEFMSGIQAHHAKLWYAGQNENWRLADFEVHEIMELIQDIKTYETERKESKDIDMIDPVLDSVNNAIEHKNPIEFRKSFILLTNTCNDCHKAVKFDFNVVKIPDFQQFSNQDFKLEK